VIEAQGLVKTFGSLRAVDGVGFTVRKGELYGLLGPNGAGKTTTMSMLAGLLAPDEGQIRFDGVDLAARPLEVKRGLGVVPQEPALYETLSARENLRFWGGLYGLSGRDLAAAVDHVLDLVGLSDRAAEPIRGYSGGMKRRLNLALGLVHRPHAVLMDEPTVGIDPQARLKILEAVKGVAAAGTTVIYTTHYLEEAEDLCDRIAIMDHGKILEMGTVDELVDRRFHERAVRFDTIEGLDDARLAAMPGVTSTAREDGETVLYTRDVPGTIGAVLEASEELKAEPGNLAVRRATLEDVFLALTGRTLRD